MAKWILKKICLCLLWISFLLWRAWLKKASLLSLKESGKLKEVEKVEKWKYRLVPLTKSPLLKKLYIYVFEILHKIGKIIGGVYNYIDVKKLIMKMYGSMVNIAHRRLLNTWAPYREVQMCSYLYISLWSCRQDFSSLFPSLMRSQVEWVLLTLFFLWDTKACISDLYELKLSTFHL